MKEYLQDRDKRRIKKTERNRSSEVKLKRTEKLRDTIKKEIQQDVEAKKQGKTYTSSAQPDLKVAQKAVHETMRKNRATNSINNDLLPKRCRYYPHFCEVVGHASAASSACQMHGKSKAADEIEEILVRELLQKQGEGE